MTEHRATRLVDLSHPIEAGMVTYPGLPGPEISRHLTRQASRSHYAAGVEFSIDRISMVGNTGTYVDSPYHRYPEGVDLAGLPLASVADLPLVVVRLAEMGAGGGGRGIGPEAHLTRLSELPVSGARLHAVPAPVRDFGSFPVRAYAVVRAAPGGSE